MKRGKNFHFTFWSKIGVSWGKVSRDPSTSRERQREGEEEGESRESWGGKWRGEENVSTQAGSEQAAGILKPKVRLVSWLGSEATCATPKDLSATLGTHMMDKEPLKSSSDFHTQPVAWTLLNTQYTHKISLKINAKTSKETQKSGGEELNNY